MGFADKRLDAGDVRLVRKGSARQGVPAHLLKLEDAAEDFAVHPTAFLDRLQLIDGARRVCQPATDQGGAKAPGMGVVPGCCSSSCTGTSRFPSFWSWPVWGFCLTRCGMGPQGGG